MLVTGGSSGLGAAVALAAERAGGTPVILDRAPPASGADHEVLVHAHRHYHVTHNFRDMTGGFEHLSSEHEHEHDHAAISHSHHPHENFESEHADEAHVHDHAAPVDGDGGAAPAKATARNAPAKKAPAKKSTKAAATRGS